MIRSYLSLGSNIGDRIAFLKGAVDALKRSESIRVEGVSSVYETEPVGFTDQPDFLNIAVAIDTSLDPHALLDLCQSIETEHDRKRTVRWGPRTLDVDILLYGDEVVDSERLQIPHPRMTERAFVLIPLVELTPTVTIRGKRADALLQALGKRERQEVRRYADTAGWI